MRHKILPITHIANAIKGIQKIGFKVIQCFGGLLHTQPKYPRHSVASEKSRTIKVHRERLVVFCHFLASFYNGWNILVGCLSNKF